MSEAAVPPRTVTVDLEPVGRRVTVAVGATVMDAARAAGVELVSICGGAGVCGSCCVHAAGAEGAAGLAPGTPAEQAAFTPGELDGGCRLACQARVCGDVRIVIPPASLATPQRLQLEGQEAGGPPGDPVVVPLDVAVEPPTSRDLRADAARLAAACTASGHPALRVGRAVLADAAERLRAQAWHARLALRRDADAADEVVAVLPPAPQAAARLCGLAVDVGTTKLAAYLVDLETGRTLARQGAMNPQIAYGEDVVSRIAAANRDADVRRRLQACLVEQLNEMVTALCAEAGITPGQVVEAVVVGNTAMHHLFAGLPVRQLGAAPYVPVVADPLVLRAQEVGLALAPGARVYLPPNIAGYVGADHVAMLLATGVDTATAVTVALDIGTNTEITLAAHGRLLTCSCASGPAFEGAHIHDGMRAMAGAVEHVRIVDGALRVHTIGGGAPVGLCGSGILDAVAALREAGVLDARGAFRRADPRVVERAGHAAFVLTPAACTAHGHDLVVTRRDVHEVQLAKGAIRAGVEVLLAEAGLTAEAVEACVVAGAFGTYLDLASAVRIGLLPAWPAGRFRQVGNAAGMGALQLLRAAGARTRAAEVARRITYVELTTHPGFTDAFMHALFL